MHKCKLCDLHASQRVICTFCQIFTFLHSSSLSLTAAVPAGPATVKSAEVYANSALRPTRVWPSGSPENPFTQVIYWHKSPYARLKKDGWMRVCGMQSGKGGKVEMILEARGGNQYTLEVPLRQVSIHNMSCSFNRPDCLTPPCLCSARQSVDQVSQTSWCCR